MISWGLHCSSDVGDDLGSRTGELACLKCYISTAQLIVEVSQIGDFLLLFRCCRLSLRHLRENLDISFTVMQTPSPILLV